MAIHSAIARVSALSPAAPARWSTYSGSRIRNVYMRIDADRMFTFQMQDTG